MRGWEDRRVRGCNKRRVNDGRVRGDEDGSRVGARSRRGEGARMGVRRVRGG